jgi:hypothetical protein
MDKLEKINFLKQNEDLFVHVPGYGGARSLIFNIGHNTANRVLGHTQPPIQWVPGAFSLGVKRPGREADHSPPFSAEIKE